MAEEGDTLISKPIGGPKPGQSDEDQPSPAELILDVLVAHEFRAGSVAAKLMWDAVDWSMPIDVKVTPQVKRSDGRTTDVQVEGDGRRLLCEDKVADGLFQPGQLASYLKEVRDKPHVRAVVIAPRKFIDRLDKTQLQAPRLVGVAIEDLVAALSDFADQLASDPSPAAQTLVRSCRYRAEVLDRLCSSKSPALSDLHVAFVKAYNERAGEIAAGRVRLREGTLSQRRRLRLVRE